MSGLIIDAFAGGGGASVGIEMALGRPVDIAVNHDPQAIRMHEVNHPGTLHLTEDIFKVDLLKYVNGRKVELMWASLDCFPAGNLVWTNYGYKNIEEIECGDYVLTHTGEYKKVYRFIKKNDRKFCNIKISGCEKFQSTLNHPFYVRKKKYKYIHGNKRNTIIQMEEPEWISAEKITNEYRVAIPINQSSVIPKWEGYIKYTRNQYGITRSEICNTLNKYMDKQDFWWFVGRYIGDGSLSLEKGIVDLCCPFKEIDQVKKVINRLGIKYTERDKKTTHDFIFSNMELCKFLERFGVGSGNKSIIPEILNLPKNILKSFLDGYLSADGCWDCNLKNPRCSVTTISRKLAYGIQQCLLKVYEIYASMSINENPNNIIEGRVVNSKKSYTLSFYKNKTNKSQYKIEDNIAWVNVKECEIKNDYQKSVYTLSVEDNESFTINNVVVHNCTSHSKAKGGQPRERGLRILPWAVYKHASQILPEVIIMENVEEIQQWGPLDENGRPIPEKKGEDYQKFIATMKSVGYEFDFRELVAADYGAPTTRKRWYAIFRRDGKEIVWPEPTHSKGGIGGLIPWKQCGDYIDWSDLGKSIFDRKKPLADATMRRIANGYVKYIVNNPDPYIVRNQDAVSFLIQYHGEQKAGHSRGQLLTEPIKTIDTSNRYGLVTAFVTKFYKSGIGQGCDEPLHTITTSPGHFGVISAFLIKYYGTGGGQELLSPLATITTKDRFGLVNVITDINGEKYILKDIFLRMLKPEELKVMQGFPEDYIIDRDISWKPYPIKEQVARIGNSVVPVMAEALVRANCPHLKVGERVRNLRIDDSGEQLKFA